jgi:YidC/Oxa1 family membrane protein insertase
MMDKKTTLVMVGCLIALILSQKIINTIYPPKPRPLAAVATNTVPLQAQASVSTPGEQPVASPTVAPAQPEQPHLPEQIVTLSNEFMLVDFTSWGGGVRSVELLKHKGHGNDPATLNGVGLVPALSLIGVPGAGSNDMFAIQAVDANTVLLRSGNGVTKTITLSNDYLMAATVQIPAALAPSGTVSLVVGTAAPTQPREPPNYLVVDWEEASKFRNLTLARVDGRVKAGKPHEDISAGWVAVKSQYFTMVVSPATNVTGVSFAGVVLTNEPPAPPIRGVTAAADVPLTRGAGGSASCTFTYYAGPKDYNRLAALGKHQEELMDFGTPMDFYSGLFGVILLHSLNFFYRLIPSYGVAILLVTVALKIIFWPIQAKSIQSMKAMQKFQPLMTKLREKYKDGP